MSGGAIVDDLTYLLLYWVATLLSAFLAKVTHLSPLVYYLIFGMILGNTKIVHQTEFLASFSEVAITIVFFALGLEENVRHFMEGIRKAWGIALIGAAVPFGIGFACMVWFWPGVDMKAAMMGALAVTATAVSLTMISLKAEGLATSKPAIGIMTSAVIDDILCLALTAICVPIATGDAEPTAAGIIWILVKAALFFICIAVAHLVFFPSHVETGWLSYIPGLRHYGLRHVLSFSSGEQASLISLFVGLFFGMVAVWLGFHPAIGAYMAGLIVEEWYYDLVDGEGNTYQHTLHNMEDAAYCWLGPIFFINLGAQIPINGDLLKETIGYSIIFFFLLGIGQWLSATFSAKYVPGGFTWHESAMIGFGMLGRAELFFVVLGICKQKGIFDLNQTFTFTITAVLLDIAVPISIVAYKPFYLRAHPKDGSCPVEQVLDQPMSPRFKRKRTEVLLSWVRNKAHRQTMKKDRRVFKADAPDPARVHSKESQTKEPEANRKQPTTGDAWEPEVNQEKPVLEEARAEESYVEVIRDPAPDNSDHRVFTVPGTPDRHH